MGERPRAGGGAPRSFIFLSNRKKKKENTDAHVKSRPRRSQVASTGVKVLFEVLNAPIGVWVRVSGTFRKKNGKAQEDAGLNAEEHHLKSI